jgi:hypothetical protein
MEAVWKIEVEDCPAFTVINHEGKDFSADLGGQKASGLIQVSDPYCDYDLEIGFSPMLVNLIAFYLSNRLRIQAGSFRQSITAWIRIAFLNTV